MTTVFSPMASAHVPYTVRYAYRTDVLTADDDTEQRVQLRVIPTRQDRFSCRAFGPFAQDGFRAGWLQGSAYLQTQQWAVPYWPHGSVLGANATAGSAVVLTVDTTTRDFVVGSSVILWRDERTTELCTISAKSSTTLTVATLASNWSAGTFVIPGITARWGTHPSLTHIFATGAESALVFDAEHGTNPGVSTPGSPAVFTVVPVHRLGAQATYTRSVDRIESPTYTFQDFARGTCPVGGRPLRVWLANRTSVASLIAWFHGLKGALTAFWLPTYQQDMIVTAGFGSSSLTIQRMNYTTALFPHESRRHLGFCQADGTITHRRVTASVDNGSGANTETLTLSGAAPAATTQTSFLLYCRLSDDAIEINWRNNSFAECALQVIELPRSTPTAT